MLIIMCSVILGNLSKPATILIEKISNAIGITYEPTRIKRKARANAEAYKIEECAKYDIASELEERTIKRLIKQESIKQMNIEKIIYKIIEKLPESADTQKLDNDWIMYFFKNCDSISDDAMQTLWADLLLEETKNIGTFSKRTVNCISTMDKLDAELFTKLCQFSAQDDLLLIYDVNDPIYSEQDIDFNSLNHLSDIGLISFDDIAGYSREGLAISKTYHITYFSTTLKVKFSKEDFNTGRCIFSQIGKELLTICGAKENIHFVNYLIEQFTKQDIEVSL